MSDELLAIADRVLGWARDDEQVEVVVGRSTSTEVRVYEGEVESLSSAGAQGVGVRVVADRRQGFAYAGTLDDDVLAEALAEARDNATFATEDEFAGLAEPDGVPVPELDLYRAGLAAVPTDRKVALAIELERGRAGADPRITGVEAAEYADVARRRRRSSSTTGIRSVGPRDGLLRRRVPAGDEGDETQTGFGFSVGREPGELDVATAAADAAERATRLLGAVKPAGGRMTVVLDPYVTAQLLGILAATLNGEAVTRAGRCSPAGSASRSPPTWSRSSTTPPTRWPTGRPRPTARGWPRAATCWSTAACCGMFLHNAYSARRAGTASTGSAVARLQVARPASGAGRCRLARAPGPRPSCSPTSATASSCQSVSGLHSGVNPVSGDFSTGAEGLRIRGGDAGRAAARVHDRVDAPADAARRRRRRRRRRVAPDGRRRGQPGGP